MYKRYVGLVGLLIIFSSSANAAEQIEHKVPGKTYLQYEHNYKTESRKNGDSIKIVHQTPNKWHFEVKFSAYPNDKDYMYQNEYGGSAGLVISHSMKLTKKTSMTPSFEMDMSSDSLQYLIGGKINRKLSKTWSGYIRYRYQYRQYSRSDRYATQTVSGVETEYRKKGDIGTHRFETGITYRGIKDLKLTYIVLYDYARYVNAAQSCSSSSCNDKKYYLYNNKHGYLYNEIKFQYTGWKKIIPYLEIDQKAVSGSSDHQQAVIKTGVNWYF
ncbi:MAG: hypothetical protein CENE_00803 [Candidatus Celerinatantimonas neptuna]|nr:MAG: hypothetical protein CENE_00803 [Candidatus Celerinatantimonas neptuna]